MLGMLSLLLVATPLVLAPSPMKLSFFLVILSLCSSGLMLMTKSVSLAPAMVVISFSSGMMVIFCYCSIMTLYEKKSMSLKAMIPLTGVPAVLSFSEMESDLTQMSEMSVPYLSVFLLTAMMIVILSLISVNKSVFHPKKANMNSYYMNINSLV